MSVKAAAGAAIRLGAARREDDGPRVQVPLPALSDGVYVVSWQATASDGHLSIGEFAFAVGSGGRLPAVVSQASGVIDWGRAAVRWPLLLGLLLALGGLASELVVWRPVVARYGLAVPALPVGWLLLVGLVAAMAQTVLLEQAAGAWSSFLRSPAGVLALAQVVAVAYALWLLPLRRARPLMLPPLVVAVAIAAVQGHAGSWSPPWAAPAELIHLLAIGLWLGGLAHAALALVRRRDGDDWVAVAAGLRRYSALALGLVAVTLVSGALVALAEFTALSQLATTEYGRALLVKLLLVAAALGFAWTAVGSSGALPGAPGSIGSAG